MKAPSRCSAEVLIRLYLDEAVYPLGFRRHWDPEITAEAATQLLEVWKSIARRPAEDGIIHLIVTHDRGARLQEQGRVPELQNSRSPPS